MRYVIHAGSADGPQDEFHLLNPKDLDLEILEQEFEKLFPPTIQIPGFLEREDTNRLIESNRVSRRERELILGELLPEYRGQFHYTSAFCMWLVKHHGFTFDRRVRMHYMET